jgi:uncharacterized protein involved in outer membrane biogenesis
MSHLGKRAKNILLGIIAIPAILLALLLLALALADAGYCDSLIERIASARMKREVRFARLHLQLLSRHPKVRIENLRIGSPASLPHDDLADVGLLEIQLGLSGLLTGRLDVRQIQADRVALHLLRLGPGRNNWKMGSGKGGPAFQPLRNVRRFDITRSTIDFHDLARDLHIQGPFSHRSRAGGTFSFAGTGMLKGGPIRVRVIGGRLNGDAVGQPYPFAAELRDGATFVRARGTSGDAFDLTTYALHVAAHGPNLADIGYLFNLITPNSGPFHATTHAFSDGRQRRFDDLNVHVGASHIKGRIWSDHGGPRREIRAVFDAPVLARQDIDAMLAPIPSRNAASSISGAVLRGPPSPWIITDSPISLRRMRGADFDFTIHVARLDGYPLPLTDIHTRTDLDHGLLMFPFFDARLFGGRVSGSGRIDATIGRPSITVRGAIDGLQLAEAQQRPAAGSLAARIELAGAGQSLHEAAARSRGAFAFRIDHATLPRRAAWLLSGDLVRAALSGTSRTATLDCMSARFAGQDGLFKTSRLAMTTPLGTASGSGQIDLGKETLALSLLGHPRKKRLFQVPAPVRIAGPWLAPAVTVLPGHDAHALGLRGTLGLALTPLAGLLPLGQVPDHTMECATLPRQTESKARH